VESLGQYIQTEALEDLLSAFSRAANVSVDVFDCNGRVLARAERLPEAPDDGAGIAAPIRAACSMTSRSQQNTFTPRRA
jgi:hypothetical protein